MYTPFSMRAVLLSLFFATSLLTGVGEAEAKSVTTPINNLPQLNHFWNWAPIYTTDTVPLTTTPACSSDGCGWNKGLEPGATAAVTYKAKLIDNATGVEITDGASIPVGTQIRVE